MIADHSSPRHSRPAERQWRHRHGQDPGPEMGRGFLFSRQSRRRASQAITSGRLAMIRVPRIAANRSIDLRGRESHPVSPRI